MPERKQLFTLGKEDWKLLIARMKAMRRELDALNSQPRNPGRQRTKENKPTYFVYIESEELDADGYMDGTIQVFEGGVWVDVGPCKVKDVNG